jgi:hypothetical protein
MAPLHTLVNQIDLKGSSAKTDFSEEVSFNGFGQRKNRKITKWRK